LSAIISAKPHFTEFEIEKSIYEDDLYEFFKAAWPHIDPAPFKEGKHLELICVYLEALAHGEVPALLINIPPRHCKSLLVAVVLLAWCWAKWPSDSALFTAYAESLAQDHAIRFKQLITSDWYHEYWPDINIAFGHDKVSHYENEQGGKRHSVALGSTMGKGGRIVVFDDPHNVLEAESDDVRDRNCEKFDLILSTRLTGDNAGFCVIMQRLHARDYSGVLIRKRADLVHLCLPAYYEAEHPYVSKPKRIKSERTSHPTYDPETETIELPGDWRTEDGQLLWPELQTKEKLDKMVIHLGSYGKSGQLQQRPAPREGGMFQRSDFQFLEREPVGGVVVRGYDLASTKDAGAYTVGCKMIITPDKRIVISNITRDRLSPHGVDKLLVALAEADGKKVRIDIPQDPGQAGKHQITYLGKLLHGYDVHFSTESGAKEDRARPLSAQCENGNVYLVRGNWNYDFIDEAIDFPNGEYKDQIDAASRAYAALLKKPLQLVPAAPILIQG